MMGSASGMSNTKSPPIKKDHYYQVPKI
jgi:hypothetical protein